MTGKDWVFLAALVVGSGGGLTSFWIWARSHILRLNATVEVLRSRVRAIEARCEQRGDDVRRVFDKIEEVKKCISRTDSETAKAIGRLEGRANSRDKET